MPYRKEEFVNGEIYHIIFRAIDENLLFKNDDDYYRGIFSLYEFNNGKPIEIRQRRKERKREKIIEVNGGPSSVDKRERLVDVFAFCLMPNHIHLLLKQLKEGGITKYMSKNGTGYAGYFNRKYDHKGYVFQNRFQSVHIKNDNQLKIVLNYIHTNPISLVEPKWKELGIKNSERVIGFLKNKYRWSSNFDYLGKKNFPSVTERDFMLEIMGGVNGCQNFINKWVVYKNELTQRKDLFLE